MFTLPKLLRPIFSRQRAWLGELRIAARLLVAAYAEAAPGARPGLVVFVQTYDLRRSYRHDDDRADRRPGRSLVAGTAQELLVPPQAGGS